MEKLGGGDEGGDGLGDAILEKTDSRLSSSSKKSLYFLFDMLSYSHLLGREIAS